MTHSGGKPHAVGDRGQRYEVSYYDPYSNTRKTFGWSDTIEGAQAFARSIELHPSMQFPKIRDRTDRLGEM
jgi:hypothetical protein